MDITLIIDRSGSIGNDDDTVADQAEAMVNALIGTGSKVQQISFSSTATAVAPNGSTSSDLSSLSFTSAADITVPTSYGANGGTNWDDAGRRWRGAVRSVWRP